MCFARSMMESRRTCLLAGAAALLSGCARRAPPARRKGVLDDARLDGRGGKIAAAVAPAAFGAGVMLPEGTQSWFLQRSSRFPLAGAAKLPIAAAAFAQVDAGTLNIDRRIRITDLDLSPPPSAINRRWPDPPQGHAAEMPAIDLIALALQRGDDTACDVILAAIGGPGAVTAWLQGHGVTDMRVDRYDRQRREAMAGMGTFEAAWKDEAAWLAARDEVPAEARQSAMNAYISDPRDTTTPEAAILFLYKLALGQLLSTKSTNLLLTLMETTRSETPLLAAGLPAGARFFHAGAATPTDLGFTPATVDMGIARLADGTRFLITGLLSGSIATAASREKTMAGFARLAVGAIG
ncbi:MAG: serine hydrolase [Caulobacteraceae bacterium]